MHRCSGAAGCGSAAASGIAAWFGSGGWLAVNADAQGEHAVVAAVSDKFPTPYARRRPRGWRGIPRAALWFSFVASALAPLSPAAGSLYIRLGETGLHDNGYRDNDSSAGRDMQSDRIALRGEPNGYSYTHGSPVSPVDFRGLCQNTSHLSRQCLDALHVTGKDANAVSNANANWGVIQAAASSNNIPPELLAAIGVRESGFMNIVEQGGGQGVGVFQIDLGQHPSVTVAQASDIKWAANFAAQMLATNMAELHDNYKNFTPAQLLQATAASYNFGTGNITGNPNTIDMGTTGGNYGINVLALMICFP
jgi:RHS repeat-associated protein